MAIISPFNFTWFCLLVVVVGIIVALSVFLKNKSEKFKIILISSLGIGNIILYVFYKIWLFNGVEELLATGYHFDIFKELPLHLCNIGLFLLVIGTIFKVDFLKGYCFYVCVPGAFLALVAPSPGFFDTPLFALHNIGYYFTHCLIIMNGILLVTLGLFKPSYKNALKSIITFISLAVIAHLLNLFFTYVLGGESDYFYTMHVTDISLLNLFWNMIPVPFFYLLPPALVYGGVVYLVTIPFEVARKKKAK